jgi:hypothetical protein
MLRNLLVIFSMAVTAMTMQATVSVEKTEYKGWKNCYRVTNGEVELIVTAEVGPRIIRFGFVGGQNLFKEFAEQMGKSGEEKFQLRGGDRVWKAPEDPVATWAPDNVPVEIRVTPTGLIAREPLEPLTHLQKEIEVTMEPAGTNVRVAHRISNHTLFPLGLDDDGSGRSRGCWTSATRASPPESGSHEPACDVGLYKLGRPSLEIHSKVSDAAAGSGQYRTAKTRIIESGYLGCVSAQRRSIH